jgi:hypothetical protein
VEIVLKARACVAATLLADIVGNSMLRLLY